MGRNHRMTLSGKILWYCGRVMQLEPIRHDIPEADREWFAKCQMRQAEKYPWIVSDFFRCVMYVALFVFGSGDVLKITAAVMIAILSGLYFLVRYSTRIAPRTFDRLNFIRAILLVRGFVWALAIGAAMVFAPDGAQSLVVFFGTSALMIDLLFMVSLPKIGLVTSAFNGVAMGAALIITDAASVAAILATMLMMMLSAHFGTFHLFHLFATRRLRTKSLKTANETIQVLLGQYDQHGSDWLVDIDRRGRLVHPSNRMCAALGRPREAVEGMHIMALIQPGPELRQLLNASRDHKQISNHLLPARVQNEQRWWSISGCAIFDNKGEYTGYRAFVQDVTEKHAAEDRVHTLALTDALTGLANRAVFTARIEQALAKVADDQTIFGVLFVDLDSFKTINDTLGHAAGDEVLRQSAERIAAIAKPGDVAARLGGDEFALIVSSAGDADEIVERADALSDAMARPFRIDDRSIASGASIGVAIAPRDGADSEALLRAADLALYEAKARGRGRSIEYQPALLVERAERRALEVDLRQALDRGEFLLHYQPQIDIPTRAITGYEALLR